MTENNYLAKQITEYTCAIYETQGVGEWHSCEGASQVYQWQNYSIWVITSHTIRLASSYSEILFFHFSSNALRFNYKQIKHVEQPTKNKHIDSDSACK